jgi:hypothetical protein
MRDQMRDPISNPDELDLLLDSALATYADPGCNSGLENHVLSALAPARAATRARIAPHRRGWLPWAIAIPLAACLFLLWLFASQYAHAPTPPEEAHQTQPTPESDIAASAPNRVPAAVTKPAFHKHHTTPVAQQPSQEQTATATPLPKLDVFPTPQPLTSQEHSLIVAVRASEPVRAALVKAQKQDDTPIRIAAIRIPPLESLSSGQP